MVPPISRLLAKTWHLNKVAIIIIIIINIIIIIINIIIIIIIINIIIIIIHVFEGKNNKNAIEIKN